MTENTQERDEGETERGRRGCKEEEPQVERVTVLRCQCK
jgi:hypothetical protein